MSDFDSDPDSDSDSDSESDSDSNTAFINLDMYIFFFYTCILLNKPADNFFLSSLTTKSILTQAMQV